MELDTFTPFFNLEDYEERAASNVEVMANAISFIMNEEWLQVGMDLGLPSDVTEYMKEPEVLVKDGYMVIAANPHPDFFIAY